MTRRLPGRNPQWFLSADYPPRRTIPDLPHPLLFFVHLPPPTQLAHPWYLPEGTTPDDSISFKLVFPSPPQGFVLLLAPSSNVFGKVGHSLAFFSSLRSSVFSFFARRTCPLTFCAVPFSSSRSDSDYVCAPCPFCLGPSNGGGIRPFTVYHPLPFFHPSPL